MRRIPLLEGLRIAKRHKLTPLEIEVDDFSDILPLMVNENTKFRNILYDCRDLLQLLENPPIRHTFREANSVADAFTREDANMDIQTMYLL